MKNKELRKVGLKVTIPRIKILGILESNPNLHLTAEEVYRALLESGDGSIVVGLGWHSDWKARGFRWDAVTRQFTAYGQVHNEFDAYYDWMHHGESSLYIYYFGLADPYVTRDRDRALRFGR